MTDAPLFAWVVWRDLYPQTPVELCTLEAADRAAAVAEAESRYPGDKLLIQSAASARVQKRERTLPTSSVRAHAPQRDHRGEARRLGRAPARAEPMSHQTKLDLHRGTR